MSSDNIFGKIEFIRSERAKHIAVRIFIDQSHRFKQNYPKDRILPGCAVYVLFSPDRRCRYGCYAGLYCVSA